MRLMEAVGFEARVALQRSADEERLTILHFRRRRGQTAGVEAAEAGAAGAAGASAEREPSRLESGQ